MLLASGCPMISANGSLELAVLGLRLHTNIHLQVRPTSSGRLCMLPGESACCRCCCSVLVMQVVQSWRKTTRKRKRNSLKKNSGSVITFRSITLANRTQQVRPKSRFLSTLEHNGALPDRHLSKMVDNLEAEKSLSECAFLFHTNGDNKEDKQTFLFQQRLTVSLCRNGRPANGPMS